MGREIRRVPLDFDHPIGDIWPGYLRSCDGACNSEGCADCASIDPPTGDGWQLWETTSEGSPVGPVFPDAESLAVWMSQNPVGFAGSYIDLDTARRWVNGPGWSPSMVFRPATGLRDGITDFADEKRGEP